MWQERAFPDFNCHRAQGGRWCGLREDFEELLAVGPKGVRRLTDGGRKAPTWSAKLWDTHIFHEYRTFAHITKFQRKQ